ncbi:MAG: hypothetical protein ACRDFS_04800 [Chloroflexota bacterium]
MALLQLLREENLLDDHLDQYLEDLYRIVCVSSRPASMAGPTQLVRSTYVVDWEQLVHLLEDYDGFGEDIVELSPVSREEAVILRHLGGDRIARA